MANIFRKLAICHASFEISCGYYSKDWKGNPEYIAYAFRPFFSEGEWNSLEYAEVITDEVLPEMGSRAYRNIYVVQVEAKQIGNGSSMCIPLVMVDWVDVEEGVYKYQVFEKEGKIWVKMIIVNCNNKLDTLR